MKYFFYILSHDGGKFRGKTAAKTARAAAESIQAIEGCPACAIELHEVVKHFFTWSIRAAIAKGLTEQFNTI